MAGLVRAIAVASAPTRSGANTDFLELNLRHWTESLQSGQPKQRNGLSLQVPD